jgi:hypothetical protein
MSPSRPYALEVWRKHTWAAVNQTPPYCSDISDCERHLLDWIKPASKPLTNWLGWRLACNRNVRVTEFYNVSTLFFSSWYTTEAPDGHTIFTSGICTCDENYGYVSDGDCSPNAFAVTCQTVLTMLFVWLVYLAVSVVTKLVRGRFKSKRKKRQAVVTTVLLLSQVTMTTGIWAILPVVSDYSSRAARNSIGLITGLVAAMVLICLMTLNLADMVSKGASDTSIQQRLKWVARMCRAAPVIVGVAVVIYEDRPTGAPAVFLAVVLITFVAFITAAYGYCIVVLDRRVLRLLPRVVLAAKKRSERRFYRNVCCFARTVKATPFRMSTVEVSGDVAAESLALLSTSKRLRRMASLQCRWNLLCLITGISVMVARELVTSVIVEIFVFVAWQTCMAINAIIGFGDEGNVALSPISAIRSVLGSTKSTTTAAAVGIDDDDAESTDVGTLGS